MVDFKGIVADSQSVKYPLSIEPISPFSAMYVVNNLGFEISMPCPTSRVALFQRLSVGTTSFNHCALRPSAQRTTMYPELCVHLAKRTLVGTYNGLFGSFLLLRFLECFWKAGSYHCNLCIGKGISKGNPLQCWPSDLGLFLVFLSTWLSSLVEVWGNLT